MAHLGVNRRVLSDIRNGTKELKEGYGIHIAPEPGNMYRIHFLLPGPEQTPFEGGLYHGMVRLNNNHPHGAPNLHMITPNGRFVWEAQPIPASSRGICTSDTAFHPEAWTATKNLTTILGGTLSLMCDLKDSGVGSVPNPNPEQIKRMAKESLDHLKHDETVMELFPEIYDQIVSDSYVPIKLSSLSTTQTPPEPVPAKKTLEPKAESSTESSVSESIELCESTKKKTNKAPVVESNEGKSTKRKPKKAKKVESSEESEEKPSKRKTKKAVKVESSDEESEEKPSKRKAKKTKKVESSEESEEKPTKRKTKKVSKVESSEESEEKPSKRKAKKAKKVESSEESEEKPTKRKTKKAVKVESPDEESEEKPTKRKTKKAVKVESSEDSSSDDSPVVKRKSAKRKASPVTKRTKKSK